MDSRNLIIGVLSTTATILLVGVVVVHTRPPVALADGMTVAKGDYILTVGNSAQVDEEFLYVIDAPEQKMVVYRFNTTRGQIEMLQGIDLKPIREAAASGAGAP